jgi:hypothetical protein
MIFFGLAAGVIGKIKGSSFFVWFAIGFFLPFLGLLAAILYRFDRYEPKRRCPRCGRVRDLTDQVCTNCGEELYFPPEDAIIRPQP